MPLQFTDAQLNGLFEEIPALAGRPRQLEELSGGLTNRNVKVTTPDGVYVARCSDTASNSNRPRPSTDCSTACACMSRPRPRRPRTCRACPCR